MLSREDILAILAFGDMDDALNKKGRAVEDERERERAELFSVLPAWLYHIC